MNYRDLISEKDFLKVAVRARALMRDGSDLIAIKYKDRQLIFKTRSGTDRRLVWTQTIEITDDLLDAIAKGKSFRTVEDLIKYANLKVYCNCLAKGTRVLTKEGYKVIEDVTESDYVLGSDCNWHKVVTLLKSKRKKKWFRVSIKGVREPLIVSEDHKLLFSTYRDKCACGCGRSLRPCSDHTKITQAFKLFESRKFIPKHASRCIADGFKRYDLHSLKDYKIGELLCTPIYRGGKQFDKDYARMLGYYLAEGHIPSKGTYVVITLNQNEEDTIAADIKEYFERQHVRVVVAKRFYNKQKWLTVSISSKQFREDCRYFCGQGSKDKFIHTDVLDWCDEAKEAFLVGHLLGDGAVDDSFRWLSTSKNIVDMLQLVLASIKVNASTYIANNAREPRSACYATCCAINKFYDVYYKYKHLFRDKDIIEKNNSRGQRDVDEFCLRKIIGIEEVEEQEGYDIVLDEEPHTYLANNIVVSNCPAFKFWGFQYIAWKKGYGLVKETRRPVVRNPHERGYLCFVAGTNVLTSTGYKPIEDVKPGDYVFTHKGRLRRVLVTSSHYADETVNVRYGATNIRCTPNHPFLHVSNYSKSTSSTKKFNPSIVDWCKAEDLKVGDFLVAPYISLEHTDEVPLREAFFTGLYAADGSLPCRRQKAKRAIVSNGKFYSHGSMRIALDTKYPDIYHKICDKYNVPFVYKEQKSCYGSTGALFIEDALIRQRALDTVNFTSSELQQEKTLSESILSWSVDAQKEFIRGFFLGDGTMVNGSGNKSNHSVYFTLFNTNKRIMEMLCVVLKQWFDVKVNFYDRKPFEEYGRVISPKRMYYIRFTGAQAKQLAELLGDDIIKCKSFGYKQCRYTDYRLAAYTVQDTKVTPKIIKEITHEEGAVVYNMEVEEDNSYIVEDVAVHNCKHLHLVLTLYPFWSKALASKFIHYYKQKKEYEDSISGIHRARMNKTNQSYVDDLKSKNPDSPEEQLESEIQEALNDQ